MENFKALKISIETTRQLLKEGYDEKTQAFLERKLARLVKELKELESKCSS